MKSPTFMAQAGRAVDAMVPTTVLSPMAVRDRMAVPSPMAVLGHMAVPSHMADRVKMVRTRADRGAEDTCRNRGIALA